MIQCTLLIFFGFITQKNLNQILTNFKAWEIIFSKIIESLNDQESIVLTGRILFIKQKTHELKSSSIF